MNKLHKKRLLIALFILFGLGLTTTLVMVALKKNINLYYTINELQTIHLPPQQTIRIGGLVKKNSVTRNADNLMVQFVITDLKHDLPVHYRGVLPDLFREGQGVVLRGQFKGDYFAASEVLAKHDENYMPKEVKDTLQYAKGKS